MHKYIPYNKYFFGRKSFTPLFILHASQFLPWKYTGAGKKIHKWNAMSTVTAEKNYN